MTACRLDILVTPMASWTVTTGGQSLGNSGYSKRDSQHEGVHNDRPAEVMSAEQGEGEDEYTDGQHADAENL